MRDKLNILKKVLVPSDSIAIAVVIIGLLIAIFLPELAIRLIGACVAILGTLALFMMVSQRMKDTVSSRYMPASKPDYKISVKKDSDARRQVIEGFEDSFGPEPEEMTESKEAETDDFGKDMNFRIIRKKKPAPEPEPLHRTAQEPKEDLSEFSDGLSSVKIISKKKAEPQPPEIPPQTAKQENKSIPSGKSETQKQIVNEPVQDSGSQEVLRFEDEDLPQENNEQQPEYQQVPQPEPVPQKPAKYREKDLDISLSMLIEDQPVIGQEPRKEFEYYLMRVLKIIRSVTSTRTAAFMLVNHDKHELILESYDTDYLNAIVSNNKLQLGNDVVSQIVLNEKPEILTEINPSAETDLIPYYTRAVGASSFIGVPVFYNSSVIGILCADTEVTDAYDSVTVSFLGHFTKLIGALLQSYTEKYELVQASRTLQSIGSFRDILSSNNSLSLQSICESTVEAASNLFEYSMLGVCVYDGETGNWKIGACRSRRDNEPALENNNIELDETLLGSSVMTGRTVFVSPLTGEYMRVQKDEAPLVGGSFAAVPLKSMLHNYGALFIEGKSQTSITAYDISILETLGENAGICIEQMYCMNMLESTAIFDNSTGTMNPTAFFRRAEEELYKTYDFNIALTLCLFRIDNYTSLNSAEYRDRAERVLYHVIEIVKKNLRPYDVFGKINDDTFGIVISGMNLKDAQLWAERLRLEIARSVIEINNRRFSVTISMGLAAASGDETLQDLFTNAHKVLGMSLNKMNCVSVFA